MANNNLVTKVNSEERFYGIYFGKDDAKRIVETIPAAVREARMKRISEAEEEIYRVIESSNIGHIDEEYGDIIIDDVGYNKWIDFWKEPEVIALVGENGAVQISDYNEDLLKAYEDWKELQPDWERKKLSDLTDVMGRRCAALIQGAKFVKDKDGSGKNYSVIKFYNTAKKSDTEIEWKFGRRMPEFGEKSKFLYAEDYFGDIPEIRLAKALNAYSQSFWPRRATYDKLKEFYAGEHNLTSWFNMTVDDYLKIRFESFTFLLPEEEKAKERIRNTFANDVRFSSDIVDVKSFDAVLTKMFNVIKGWCKNVDRASGVEVDEPYEDKVTGKLVYERGDMLNYFYDNIQHASTFDFFSNILNELKDQDYEKKDGTTGNYNQWSLTFTVYNAFRKTGMISYDTCKYLLALGGTAKDGARRLQWAMKKMEENRLKELREGK